ncbi:DUF3304 domain-containing protein [Metapseudomonas resinovorans]|uniref:DUF3304 domain-containing protein n=1 Tax=Metapseudomonas resinovorans NBRC 106553 TaxID=1245471 RepID=S6AEF7_METRE|nr:DUF3304 domain-containing protein [Pseudomonas resinovorans]BAN45895.1 hypothetical protein PCA10_01630 [Pseudomonas resinovorans NBRC 106553]
MHMLLWLAGGLSIALVGCSTADNEMVGGNLTSVNHVDGTAINWLEVNGYRTVGGGGRACCIVLPAKWRPGLMANIEWEVDPDRWAKLPSVTSQEFQAAYAKHAANYRRYSTTVEIPEYQEKRCGLTVHFLPCQQVKVTTSCWASYSPNYPIQDPRHVKEPAVCPK